VYVSGFPNVWTTDNLTEVFSEFGSIHDIRIIVHLDFSWNNNCGLAFIHFVFPDSAMRAVNALHNTIPNGTDTDQTMIVRLANANKNAPPDFLTSVRVNMSRRKFSLESSTIVSLSQLPAGWTHKEVRCFYEQFGLIAKVT